MSPHNQWAMIVIWSELGINDGAWQSRGLGCGQGAGNETPPRHLPILHESKQLRCCHMSVGWQRRLVSWGMCSFGRTSNCNPVLFGAKLVADSRKLATQLSHTSWNKRGHSLGLLCLLRHPPPLWDNAERGAIRREQWAEILCTSFTRHHRKFTKPPSKTNLDCNEMQHDSHRIT